jgi:hypothetical protein
MSCSQERQLLVSVSITISPGRATSLFCSRPLPPFQGWRTSLALSQGLRPWLHDWAPPEPTRYIPKRPQPQTSLATSLGLLNVLPPALRRLALRSGVDLDGDRPTACESVRPIVGGSTASPRHSTQGVV